MACSLAVLGPRLAISRLPADAPVPPWADGGALSCVCRTTDELSIVCVDEMVPASIPAERGWRALKVDGPIPFSTTGVLAGIAGPLAEARISIFALSTFDTDYVLVREGDLDAAVDALEQRGHTVRRDGRPPRDPAAR